MVGGWPLPFSYDELRGVGRSTASHAQAVRFLSEIVTNGRSVFIKIGLMKDEGCVFAQKGILNVLNMSNLIITHEYCACFYFCNEFSFLVIGAEALAGRVCRW